MSQASQTSAVEKCVYCGKPLDKHHHIIFAADGSYVTCYYGDPGR